MIDSSVSSLVSSVTFVSNLLVIALTTAGTVVLLRLTQKESFSIWNVTFDVKYAWIVFVLFTVAHLYVGNLICKDADAVAERSIEAQQDAWNQITKGSFFLLHDMQARTAWVNTRFLFVTMPRLQIQSDDSTKILHYACALLLFAACTNWHGLVVDSTYTRVRRTLLFVWRIFPRLLGSAIIVFLNWTTATNWIYALSQLAPPQ